MAKSKAGKALKKTVQIVQKNANAEFIGTPIRGRAIYDYIEIDNRRYNLLSAYGTFKVETDKEGKVQKDMWKMAPYVKIPDSPLLRLKFPMEGVEQLLHFPTYRGVPRFTRLSMLFLKVKAKIASRVRFQHEDVLNGVTLWVLGTHIHAIFSHFPILDLAKAGYNSGGSVALKTILSYCARPMIIQSSSESPLFRLANDLRPTIGIEEFTTGMNEEHRKAILQLLDGSFDLNVRIPKTENFRVKSYDFYGPRIVVDPQGLFGQYSTASRCLVAPLVNEPGMQSNADNILDFDMELIQTLYDLPFFYSNKVRYAYNNCKIEGSGRLDQTFRPLVSIALVLKREGLDIVDSVMAEIQRQFSNLEAVKTEGDNTKQIFAAILDLIDSKSDDRKWLHTSSDGTHYVRIPILRNMIATTTGIEYQTDKGASGTRYWARPSKEMGETLGDPKRFAAMLRTFLPDFVGNAEPGSRNLCLFFKDQVRLAERLVTLTGSSYKSYNYLHVGLHTEPVFSSVIYNKNKKILYNYNTYTLTTEKHERSRKHVWSSRNVGKSQIIELPDWFFTAPVSDPTSSKVVGFDQNGSQKTPENIESVLNPTRTKNEGQKTNGIPESLENTGFMENPTTDSSPLGKKSDIKSQPDPVKSAVQNENSITEDEWKKIINTLIQEGYHVIPNDSGLSMDRKSWKIAITKPIDSSRLQALQDRMKSLNFVQVNSGSYGPLFFTMPLKGGSA